jgi:hypothetical protein
MATLTSEEKENTRRVEHIMHICVEAMDQDDKTILGQLRTYLAPDIVITAPALARLGVFLWEMQGLEQVIHRFGRIFIDLQLTTLTGSKPMVHVMARNRRVKCHNTIGGLALMAEGMEFVPRVGFVQRHTLEFQFGYVKRWTIEDDPLVVKELANFFSTIS